MVVHLENNFGFSTSSILNERCNELLIYEFVSGNKKTAGDKRKQPF